MIVLSASNLGKTYGTDVILENVSFHIEKGDRVGIVGANGAGKTTLLRILSGELQQDSGEFFIAKDTTIGYLKQRDSFSREKTVFEEASGIFSQLREMELEIDELNQQIASANEAERARLWDRLNLLNHNFETRGGYTYKSELTGILTSMGFDEEAYDMETGKLSGGERTRLALACLLLSKPDILMLDEPTNHLDINTLRWLENYLKDYAGTIVVISHDRYFLDSIVTNIFDMEHRTLKTYKGNYSTYVEKKAAIEDAELKAYTKQQEEIKRQEDLIRRYKERGTEKLAKRALSREKRLTHVERLDAPLSKSRPMKINFHQRFQSGNDVLLLEGVSGGYGGQGRGAELFKNCSFDVKRGEKICIVGDNGVGKTTLLKIVLGELMPLAGHIKFGHNVEPGYYDQGQLLLNYGNTVIDEIHDEYRLYTDGEIRNILGRFLFRGDAVFNKVGSLSGGEKARLSLLKLMMSGANLLILDEPTNHLDIQSKEAFETALLDYPGTVITVTHDRYFLNKIPDRIFELTKDGLTEFLGKYDYYVEKKFSSGESYKLQKNSEVSNPETEKSSPSLERELKKQREAEERKRKRETERLMERIDELESLIQGAEERLCLPENMSDHQKLAVIAREMQDWKKDLEETYERWMELAEE